jgi:hypothetical protein
MEMTPKRMARKALVQVDENRLLGDLAHGYVGDGNPKRARVRDAG